MLKINSHVFLTSYRIVKIKYLEPSPKIQTPPLSLSAVSFLGYVSESEDQS